MVTETLGDMSLKKHICDVRGAGKHIVGFLKSRTAVSSRVNADSLDTRRKTLRQSCRTLRVKNT